MIAKVLVAKKLNSELLDYEVPPQTNIERYSLVKVKLRNRSVIGLVLSFEQKSRFKVKPIEKVISNGAIFTNCQINLAKAIKNESLSSLNEIVFSFIPPLNLRDLKNLGFKTKPVVFRKFEPLFYSASSQQRLEFFCQKVATSYRQNLLVLPTIERILEAESAIKKMSSKNQVKLWHSQLKKQEKAKIWQDILEGKPVTIIGTRHSLFLPFVNLEYLFIDDPTNFAYFDDQAPYYNALSVAKKLARLIKTKLVIGSSICDLVSFANIKSGKINLIKAKNKTSVAIKPNWELLVNLSGFSQFIQKAIIKKQRVLIIDRFDTFQRPYCQDCRQIVSCKYCQEQLSVSDDKCAQCQKPYIPMCQNCQGTKIKLLGNMQSDLKDYLVKSFPILKGKIGNMFSNSPMVICDFKQLSKLKAPFDFAIFKDFDRLADIPYLGFRFKIFQSIANLQDLYVKNIIICHDQQKDSAFLKQIKENQMDEFLSLELSERKRLGLPPFTKAVKIRLKTKFSNNSRDIFLTNVKKLKYFKTVTPIEEKLTGHLVTYSIIGILQYKNWDLFIADVKEKRLSDYRVETDPVELL